MAYAALERVVPRRHHHHHRHRCFTYYGTVGCSVERLFFLCPCDPLISELYLAPTTVLRAEYFFVRSPYLKPCDGDLPFPLLFSGTGAAYWQVFCNFILHFTLIGLSSSFILALPRIFLSEYGISLNAFSLRASVFRQRLVADWCMSNNHSVSQSDVCASASLFFFVFIHDPEELRSQKRLLQDVNTLQVLIDCFYPLFVGDHDDEEEEQWADVYSIGGAKEKQAEIGEKLGQDSEIVPWEGADRLLLACPNATQFSVLR